MKFSLFIKDKTLLTLTLLLVLFTILTVIFYFNPVISGTTCVPKNSFLDPYGRFDLLQEEKEVSSPFGCLPAVTEYTSPRFYISADISVLLLLIIILRFFYLRAKYEE